MGLNHQMASLSCAIGEAHYLQRTLVLPDQICLFGLHTERWPGDAGRGAERCVPIGDLFDVEALSRLVPIRLQRPPVRRTRRDETSRADHELPLYRQLPAGAVVTVDGKWKSSRVRAEYPCGGAATLVRRTVDNFWFQQCTRHTANYDGLAARLNELVGAPADAKRPVNVVLRSGLFYSRSIKVAAAAIRREIGGPYASLHVRRSDKLQKGACAPRDCKIRDELSRPPAIDRALRLWIPPGSRVYVGSTEPPSFFDPLRTSYRLYFAEDYSQHLRNISNNYALYAVETCVASPHPNAPAHSWHAALHSPQRANSRGLTLQPHGHTHCARAD